MASADFLSFVVTHGLHTLFLSADKTSLGTTRHFHSIYLPHLLQLIPSSYWTSGLCCNLILNYSLMWFLFVRPEICLHLPSDSVSRRTPLVLAVSFPLLGRIRNFHPLATCAARRTTKKLRICGVFCNINYSLIFFNGARYCSLLFSCSAR